VVNTTAGRAIAALGVVLAFVTIWIDALPGDSYWSGDGTTGAFVLVLAGLAALALAAGYAGHPADGALFAVGAVMLGFYLFIPVALAFDQWDIPEAGTWLGICAGALTAIGAAISYRATGASPGMPAGRSRASLVAGLGIALVFPGIWLDATSDGDSYWSSSGLGHALGLFLLILAIACGLAWAAGLVGRSVRGLDSALTLVLLGFVSFFPVGAAFGDFGSLDAGAWLAFAGGILAAGGTWAARTEDVPRAAAVAV
jgi:hypothetical protein